MELYKDKENFVNAIISISQNLKINAALIEKDYFVIYLLSKLNSRIPGLLFKGGTCCSRAYKAIDRFSEDIDLSLDINHFGRKKNIEANKMIVEVCDSLGFKIINRQEVEKHSHGNFNAYLIAYPALFSSLSIKPYLQIEMSFFTKSFPDEIQMVNSIIGDWFIANGNNALAKEYNLLSFPMCVQTLERTFVDKIYALCDYYEKNEIIRNSRHIYDLYKISKLIRFNKSLKTLAKKVREERKKNSQCLSAKDGYNVNKTLMAIKNSNSFKNDYINITLKLLIVPVDYSLAINVIDKIIDENIFSND